MRLGEYPAGGNVARGRRMVRRGRGGWHWAALLVAGWLGLAGCDGGPAPAWTVPPSQPATVGPSQPQVDRPTGPTEAALWAAHNAERAKLGLPALRLARPLSNAAHSHAAYMARTVRFGHWGIGDGDSASRATAAGYRWSAIGENIAAGQGDVPTVMADWMASPGHRAAILGPYRDMGAAAFRDDRGRMWWVAMFGSP